MDQSALADRAFLDEEVCFWSIDEVARRIREKDISPTELVGIVLERIDRLGPSLNCYITVFAERSLEYAREMERLLAEGTYLGPLHGVPISVKDNIPIQGTRTTFGSAILEDWVPKSTAAVVQRLWSAGAIVIGKNNLYDFAYCAPNPVYGPTRNPWDLDRSCAGSSSGSASAVAAGLGYGSIGSDGGGSIRMPAAFCGVVGLKTTFDLVPRAESLHPTLSVMGPMTRAVKDTAILLNAIAGPDPADPAHAGHPPSEGDYSSQLEDGIVDLRVGVPVSQPSEVVDPQVRAAFEQACLVLEAEGARLIEVQLPDFTVARTLMWVISGCEAAEVLRPFIRSDERKKIHPTTYSLLRRAEFLPATEYIHAQRVRQKFIEVMRKVMASVDVVALPAVPITPFLIGQTSIEVEGRIEEPLNMSTRYTTLFNLTGQTAVVLPCGFSSDNLPIGLQLAAPPYQEALLLRTARTYERATDWHHRRPQLPIESMQQTSTDPSTPDVR